MTWKAPYRDDHPPSPEWVKSFDRCTARQEETRPHVRRVVTPNWFVVRKQREYLEMGFPLSVAKAQASLDMDRLVYRAWLAGAKQRDIAKRMRRTAMSIQQRCARQRRREARGENYDPVIVWGKRMDKRLLDAVRDGWDR